MSKTHGTPGPRTIAPTFATSRSLARCTPLARLLFGCMIASADDQGRQAGDASDLRDLFRLSCEPTEAVAAALAELVDGGLVQAYEAAGQPLLQLLAWWSWQSSARRMYPSRHPAPPGWLDIVYGMEGSPPTYAAAKRGEVPQIAADRGEVPQIAANRNLTRTPARAGADRTEPNRTEDSPLPPAQQGQPKRSRRATGDNPRARGTSPRQAGTSPRQVIERDRLQAPQRLGKVLAEAVRRGQAAPDPDEEAF